jgi:hypothetical protein
MNRVHGQSGAGDAIERLRCAVRLATSTCGPVMLTIFQISLRFDPKEEKRSRPS